MSGPVHIGNLMPGAVEAAREATEGADRKRCGHENWKPRKRVIAGGAQRVFLQCLDCGHCRALKMSEFPNWAELEDFDEDLPRRLWDQQAQLFQEQREAAAEERSREWWARYNAYLASPEWAGRRRRVLHRAQGMCEACGERRADHVHHTSYRHVGAEPLFELRAVCEACHEDITAMDRGELKPLEGYR